MRTSGGYKERGYQQNPRKVVRFFFAYAVICWNTSYIPEAVDIPSPMDTTSETNRYPALTRRPRTHQLLRRYDVTNPQTTRRSTPTPPLNLKTVTFRPFDGETHTACALWVVSGEDHPEATCSSLEG